MGWFRKRQTYLLRKAANLDRQKLTACKHLICSEWLTYSKYRLHSDMQTAVFLFFFWGWWVISSLYLHCGHCDEKSRTHSHTHMEYVHRHIQCTGAKHTCTYIHISRYSPPFKHHPLIAVILRACHLILLEKRKLSPRRKKCHISHSNNSTLAISSDFIIHYARDNLLL